MLQAKTRIQRDYVEGIVEKHIERIQDGCKFSYANVYSNCNDVVEINIVHEHDDLSIDIPFDMMAEIVDYLREQNNK